MYKRQALFIQCVTDRFAPEIAVATSQILQATGADVEVPSAQHCCGLPAIDTGDLETAKKMARSTLDALEGYECVVTPAPSCAVAMAHEYERLFQDDTYNLQRAQDLAARVADLVSYLKDWQLGDSQEEGADAEQVLRKPKEGNSEGNTEGNTDTITVHPFCQSRTRLGHNTETASQLINHLCGTTSTPLPEADVCCGFGGSSSLTSPQVAKAILARKLQNVASTGATTLITDNPGCALHLRGGAHACHQKLEVLHIAEYLADQIPS